MGDQSKAPFPEPLIRHLTSLHRLIKEFPDRINIVESLKEDEISSIYYLKLKLSFPSLIIDPKNPQSTIVWDGYSVRVEFKEEQNDYLVPSLHFVSPDFIPFHPYIERNYNDNSHSVGLWVGPTSNEDTKSFACYILKMIRSLIYDPHYINNFEQDVPGDLKALEFYNAQQRTPNHLREYEFPLEMIPREIMFELCQEYKSVNTITSSHANLEANNSNLLDTASHSPAKDNTSGMVQPKNRKFSIEGQKVSQLPSSHHSSDIKHHDRMKDYSATEAEKTRTKKKFKIAKSESRSSYEIEWGEPPESIEIIDEYIKRSRRYTDYICVLYESAWEEIKSHIDWELKRNTNEQGGLMLGRVFKQPEPGYVYGVVTKTIPGNLAISNDRFMVLSAEAWKEMLSEYDKSIQTSKEGLEVIGWYHTHPNKLDVFFSDTDLETQQRFFSQPWHLATVVNPHREALRTFHGRNARECSTFIVRDNSSLEQWEVSSIRSGESERKFSPRNGFRQFFERMFGPYKFG